MPGEGEPVEFVVDQGASASSIGSSLAEQDIIRNGLAFRILARYRGVDSSFSAGTYELETGMSVDEALEALGAGPKAPEVTRVTIPEGLTVDQTLARLVEATQFEDGAFRDVLQAARQDPAGGPLRLPEWMPPLDQFAEDQQVFEGLLFPKTYEFDPDEVTPARILQTLIDQTEVAMASASPSAVADAEGAGLSKYDALIIASLVEREARVPGEWRQIAAVIRNRLAEGMALQVDATLLYASGTPEGGPGAVDTEVESPYNTYKNPGLPPTPIAGARPEAIQAAFDPADSQVPLLRRRPRVRRQPSLRRDPRGAQPQRAGLPRRGPLPVSQRPAAWPGGRTRPLAVLGWPVAHSLSPVMHNAALAAMDLDLVYLALPAAPDRLADVVGALGAVGCVGANVTVPHKQAVVAACDRLTDEARTIGAVNTLTWTEDGLEGHNTDAVGLQRALDEVGAGRGPAVLLGTGGAARAAVVALVRRGADVLVVGRRPAAARELAELGASIGSSIAGDGGPTVTSAGLDADDLGDRVATADLVVNATPLGMQREPLPAPFMDLSAGQTAYDLVYAPPDTPFLQAAGAAGAAAHHGLSMLVHQAAAALERWTGREVPVDVMRQAAETALSMSS